MENKGITKQSLFAPIISCWLPLGLGKYDRNGT